MNHLPKVQLKPAVHKEREVIQILFEKNDVLKDLLKKNTDMRWSQTMACWYVPYHFKMRTELFNLLQGKAFLDYSHLQKETVITEVKATGTPMEEAKTSEAFSIDPALKEKIENFKQWLRSRRYSENTVGTYADALMSFLRFHSGKSVTEITNEDVVLYNNFYILKNGLSSSFQNQVVNAIKLFFRITEDKRLDPSLVHRPKRAKLLPNVLSKAEVKLIVEAPINLKHRAMLSLIYSCGLRCGELIRLQLQDIDSGRGLVIIRQSKGRKDRIVPLSLKVLELLREYYNNYKPKQYVFEGQEGGMYDERSLQNVLKQSVHKCGIQKPVTLHWLRHSYATHLLEAGTDLRYIQEILGHSSSRTTEIYTHVSTKNIQRIISPFDTL